MPRPHKHPVVLTPAQRTELEQFVSKGKPSARAALHARVLLRADQGEAGPACTNTTIAETLGCSSQLVTRVRARFATGGLLGSLHRKQQERHRPRKLDGALEAHLIALTCSQAPEGRARWTVRLLAERFVELGHVDSVSHETVRQTLKRGNSSPG